MGKRNAMFRLCSSSSSVAVKASSSSSASSAKGVPSKPPSGRSKHGKKKQDVFGVPLESVPTQDPSLVPCIVTSIVDYLTHHGMGVEGVFRRAGSKKKMNEIKDVFNSKTNPLLLELLPDGSSADVFVVADLLKEFLRELPERLIDKEKTEQLRLAHQRWKRHPMPDSPEASAEGFEPIRKVLDTLTPQQHALLSYLMGFLARFSGKAAQTKMTKENLATVIGPNIFHFESKPTDLTSSIQEMEAASVITRFFIAYYQPIFKPALPLPPSAHVLNAEAAKEGQASSQNGPDVLTMQSVSRTGSPAPLPGAEGLPREAMSAVDAFNRAPVAGDRQEEDDDDDDDDDDDEGQVGVKDEAENGGQREEDVAEIGTTDSAKAFGTQATGKQTQAQGQASTTTAAAGTAPVVPKRPTNIIRVVARESENSAQGGGSNQDEGSREVHAGKGRARRRAPRGEARPRQRRRPQCKREQQQQQQQQQQKGGGRERVGSKDEDDDDDDDDDDDGEEEEDDDDDEGGEEDEEEVAHVAEEVARWMLPHDDSNDGNDDGRDGGNGTGNTLTSHASSSNSQQYTMAGGAHETPYHHEAGGRSAGNPSQQQHQQRHQRVLYLDDSGGGVSVSLTDADVSEHTHSGNGNGGGGGSARESPNSTSNGGGDVDGDDDGLANMRRDSFGSAHQGSTETLTSEYDASHPFHRQQPETARLQQMLSTPGLSLSLENLAQAGGPPRSSPTSLHPNAGTGPFAHGDAMAASPSSPASRPSSSSSASLRATRALVSRTLSRALFGNGLLAFQRGADGAGAGASTRPLAATAGVHVSHDHSHHGEDGAMHGPRVKEMQPLVVVEKEHAGEAMAGARVGDQDASAAAAADASTRRQDASAQRGKHTARAHNNHHHHHPAPAPLPEEGVHGVGEGTGRELHLHVRQRGAMQHQQQQSEERAPSKPLSRTETAAMTAAKTEPHLPGDQHGGGEGQGQRGALKVRVDEAPIGNRAGVGAVGRARDQDGKPTNEQQEKQEEMVQDWFVPSKRRTSGASLSARANAQASAVSGDKPVEGWGAGEDGEEGMGRSGDTREEGEAGERGGSTREEAGRVQWPDRRLAEDRVDAEVHQQTGAVAVGANSEGGGGGAVAKDTRATSPSALVVKVDNEEALTSHRRTHLSSDLRVDVDGLLSKPVPLHAAPNKKNAAYLLLCCKALSKHVRTFDADFAQRHGRKPHKEDRMPVANHVRLYRKLKSWMQEHRLLSEDGKQLMIYPSSSAPFSALQEKEADPERRGDASTVVLSTRQQQQQQQQRERLEKEKEKGGWETEGGGGSGGTGEEDTQAGSTPSSDVVVRAYEEWRGQRPCDDDDVAVLVEEKAYLKSALAAFDKAFKAAHDRVPTKADKSGLRGLYARYKRIKSLLSTHKPVKETGAPAATADPKKPRRQHRDSTTAGGHVDAAQQAASQIAEGEAQAPLSTPAPANTAGSTASKTHKRRSMSTSGGSSSCHHRGHGKEDDDVHGPSLLAQQDRPGDPLNATATQDTQEPVTVSEILAAYQQRRQQKHALQRVLFDFQHAFQQKHGQVPKTRKDKEPMAKQYAKYKVLKSELEAFEKKHTDVISSGALHQTI